MASYHVYHDWDLNSGRYDVRDTDLDVASSRFFPRQVDPSYQRPRVKYTDTERIIPHLQWVEKLWKHVSQPSSMGAIFTMEAKNDGFGNYDYGVFYGDQNLGTNGGEYALISSEPGMADGGPSDACRIRPPRRAKIPLCEIV